MTRGAGAAALVANFVKSVVRHRLVHASVCASLVLATACDPVHARDHWSGDPAAEPPADGVPVQLDEATLTLAGEMDLRRLVDLVATRLGARIDYHPEQVAGTVTIRASKPVTDRELWDLLNQILLSRGLTTVRPDASGGVSVVKLQEAAQMARTEADADSLLLDAWDPAFPPPAFVSVLLPLAGAGRADAVKSIQPAMSKPGGSISLVGDAMLRISDLRSRMSILVPLVRTMDRAPTSVLISRFSPVSIPSAELSSLATDLAARLAQAGDPLLSGSLLASPDGSAVLVIAAQPDATRWLSLLRELDVREPVLTKTYVVRWHALADVAALIESTILRRSDAVESDRRSSVTVDALSGALVVRAADRDHREVQLLLDRLDQMPEQARRPMRTYEIRNRSAREVLALLNSLIQAAADSDPAAADVPDRVDRTIAGSTRPMQETSIAAVRRESSTTGSDAIVPRQLVMTVDESTNTLIVIGEPRQLEHIETLLPTLDRRQAQVELEVLILSLTEGDTLDLGAEIAYLTQQQSTAISLSSLFGLSSGTGTTRTAAGIGGTALILDPGDFAVVIRALETISKGRSLSMPRLLAGNNKPATINSVLQQPFTSTNASDTVATTSFGGTQDAGTNVTITPTIAAGDHLVLEYQISISAFVGESATPGVPPARQQNSVSGSVAIPDGHTVAIGGLKLATDAKAVSQIPLLGDLPLLGEAFKNRSNSGSESRFYVFIRANVLRHGTFEDLKRLSASEMEDAGVSDGFPVVEPRVMR